MLKVSCFTQLKRLVKFCLARQAKLNLLYRMLKAGDIEAERAGNTWLIPRRVLVELYGKDNL